MSRIKILPRELQDELAWYLTGDELLAYCATRKCNKKFWLAKGRKDFDAETSNPEEYHVYVLAQRLGIEDLGEEPYDVAWSIAESVRPPQKGRRSEPTKIDLGIVSAILTNPITADHLITVAVRDQELFDYLWDRYPDLHFFLAVTSIADTKGKSLANKDFEINVRDLVPWLEQKKVLWKELRKVI